MDEFDEDIYFDAYDYIVFAIMLIVSALIGAYFAFFAKVKQNTTSEYLMGGKTMGIFPISMSLIASYISGISLLGIPAEMYTYGTQFWVAISSKCFVSLVMALAYLPVFYNLQITSSYEYLNLRFNQTVRMLGSILFLMKMMLYIPIVIYVPALAFSQVTGINLHLVTPVVCIVCIFYTTLVSSMNYCKSVPCFVMLIKDVKIPVRRKRISVTVIKNPGPIKPITISDRSNGHSLINAGDMTNIMGMNTENIRHSIMRMIRASSSSVRILSGPFIIDITTLSVAANGGLKAVVWTDTVQTVVMLLALVAVIIMGLLSIGGFGEVWSRSEKGGRLEFFNFDWNPTIRHTFWTVSIGNFFGWLASCSINQAMVQRCLAMPSLKQARITVAILVVGIICLVSMCCFMGLLIFAYYHTCDPLTVGSIHKSDQLLPYFVMHIAASMPGLPGLFVSGVFSAALSSMSTGLNSMTGVIFEDLIKPRLKKPLSEAQASFLMKIIVVIIGSICVGLVFIVEKMGALIQASGSLAAITAGPLLGIFTMGMFLPFVNPKGALLGGIASGALITWISIGTQLQMARGKIKFPHKPVSIEGCDADWVAQYLSLSIEPVTIPKPEEPPFVLYQLSYMYYTMIGTIVSIVVGVCVSYLTGCNKNREIDKRLLSPVIYRFIGKHESSKENGVKNVQWIGTDDTVLINK